MKELPSDPVELRKLLETALTRVAELEQLNKDISIKFRDQKNDLEKRNSELAAQVQQYGAKGAEPAEMTPLNEADVTLRRLVQRIAMILQAEKVVIMFFDRERAELTGMPPAYGIDDDRLAMFHVKATHGIAGTVFREGQPAIFHDAATDPRTSDDMFSVVGAKNGITVPLVIEKRDEENRVIDRNTIGVLHAFNKRYGEDFSDEDVRLLERMSRNLGSIISNLQLYREVTEEREELLQTFESLTAGLLLVAPDMRILQINSSARAIFGMPADVIGKNIVEQITYSSVLKLIEDTISGEETGKAELHVPIAGMERIYEAQSAKVKNEEGKDLGVVAIFTDFTEMRNIDKMKSQFVAMASHELRTPLTAIKGFVSTLLMDDAFSADDRREFYMIIDQECDRLTRLIADLLNTSRIDAGLSLKPDYETVDSYTLLDKCVMIQRQATRKHEVTLEVPKDLPTLLADKDKLDQVVTNLLSNAIKYSPNGGSVKVKGQVEGDSLLISVSDEGMGIPKDHLTKVFERFHRVDNEDNRKIYGTGLGLYLVKHLVEQVHMGKVWVESEVGKGSTFFVKVPLRLDIEAAKELNK